MAETEIATDIQPASRKASRETRRVQLIEATIQVVGQRGYSRTTLTDVARAAGLSHGLVNFHFDTKEKLFGETLRYLSDEYARNWIKALDSAAPDAASQLDALIRADFNEVACAPGRLLAWCAFWGETQGRPLYLQVCAENNAEYIDQMERVCAALMLDGGYELHPVRVARALRITSEGVWLDMMTEVSPYDRDEAMATVHAMAAAFFPRHFSSDGLVAPLWAISPGTPAAPAEPATARSGSTGFQTPRPAGKTTGAAGRAE